MILSIEWNLLLAGAADAVPPLVARGLAPRCTTAGDAGAAGGA
jgi:hypothetical protein